MVNIENELKASRTFIEPSAQRRQELKSQLRIKTFTEEPVCAHNPSVAILVTGISFALICWCISLLLSYDSMPLIAHQTGMPGMVPLYVEVEGMQKHSPPGIFEFLCTLVPEAEMGSMSAASLAHAAAGLQL